MALTAANLIMLAAAGGSAAQGESARKQSSKAASDQKKRLEEEKKRLKDIGPAPTKDARSGISKRFGKGGRSGTIVTGALAPARVGKKTLLG